MWGKIERHEFPSGCNIVKTLESQPERFCARVPIAFAPQKTPKAGYHADGFSQSGRFIRRRRILSYKRIQSFPFGFVKKNRARHQ
jgi:hypothetical protein